MPRQLVTIPGKQPPAWFSPAVAYGSVVWVAGQVAMRADGSVPDDITEQVHVAIDNVEQALEAAGAGLDTLISVQVFLTDMADFAAYNEVWRESFPSDPPTRATIGVSGLAIGARCEVEVVAAR